MLEFNKIGVSEGTDVSKTDVSFECIMCNCWYFLDMNFKTDSQGCNGCHNLMQEVTSFNDITIVSVKENGYRIHFYYISKDQAINLLK